jgi:hypothetical protein
MWVLEITLMAWMLAMKTDTLPCMLPLTLVSQDGDCGPADAPSTLRDHLRKLSKGLCIVLRHKAYIYIYIYTYIYISPIRTHPGHIRTASGRAVTIYMHIHLLLLLFILILLLFILLLLLCFSFSSYSLLRRRARRRRACRRPVRSLRRRDGLRP